MILGCLTLPARIFGAVIVAGLVYLGWVNRVELRRLVHRMTAEPARSAPIDQGLSVDPAQVADRARVKLDSLAGGGVDSIVLSPAEIQVLVADEVNRRAGGLVDSVAITLGEGEVAVRAQVDAARLSERALGPLSEWIQGRQSVEARGPLHLLRVGTAEWRIEQILVRGIPLPRPLRERLIGLAVPESDGTVTIPVERWISGVRVSRRGAVLYGRSER